MEGEEKKMSSRQIRDYVADVWQFIDYINMVETDNNNMEVCRVCDNLGYALDSIYLAWVEDEEEFNKEYELWCKAKERALKRHMKKCKSGEVCPRDLWAIQLDAMCDKLGDLDLMNLGMFCYMNKLMKMLIK